MQSQPSNAGQAGLATTFDEVTRLQFVVGQMIAEMQTVALVEVVGVSNDGGVSPVGTVDVRPLVHQMAGNRTAVPHGIIYKIPYMRLQGGANAIILDPQVGDIGMCGFCSRDSSTVVATRRAALPASLRKYNWADGLYIGGFLNGTPTQYIRFSANGISIVTPELAVTQSAVVDGSLTTTGNVSVGTGATGSFVSLSGQVVTVANGIIINIV
jgi:hypothetical protein